MSTGKQSQQLVRGSSAGMYVARLSLVMGEFYPLTLETTRIISKGGLISAI